MTSECKSVPQMATLTTDAVPIPPAEAPNAHTEAVPEDNPVQNQLEGNDSPDSDDSEDPQEEQISRTDDPDTGNLKPIEVVEVASEQESSSPKVSEDKANKERKKNPSNEKRMMKPNNSVLPGPAPSPSVVYSIKNVSGLQIGPNITINMGAKQEKSAKTFPRRMPRDVEEMSRSTVPVTEEDIETVSSHVGRGWRQVGRRLKFTDGELDQYKADYTLDGRKEVIYQMLLGWKRAVSDKATRGILCNALWSSEQFDAAERLVRGQN